MMNSRLCKVRSELYLPADLWPEILCRLPVKSLLRFRCVSKSWLSLIDDADFARLHLNNFKNNRDETHLFVVHGTQRDCAVRCSDTYETNSETLFSLGDMFSQKGGWYIVCSVDGLILLESDDRTGQFNDLKVWNPSIRKFSELPSLPEIETSPDSFMMDDCIGLGYDPLANDYKIVKLLLLNYKTLHSVAIYSLGAGSWKIIKLQGKGSSFSNWHWRRDFFYSKEIYFQGSLYFLAKDAHSHQVRDLVSFDLSREVFSSVSLPNDPKFTAYGCELGLIDGGCSLALFGSSSLGKSVWVLEGCSAESESMHWTQRWSFRLEFTQFLYIKKNGDILTRSRSREEPFTAETGNKKSVKWDQVSSYSLETSKKKSVKWDQVSSYSLETNEYKILRQKRASIYIISHVCGYVESLILHR